MPTQGNDISIYVNMTDSDYAAFTGAATEEVVLDYTFDDSGLDNDGIRDTADEGNWVLIACATSATINLSNSTSETACKGDTAGALTGNSVRNVSAGNQTWNMSVDGLLDLTDYPIEEGDTAAAGATAGRGGFVNLMRAALNRGQFLVAFSTGDAGNVEYVGKAFVNSIDATAAVGDFATYSANFEGNGSLAKRTTDVSA